MSEINVRFERIAEEFNPPAPKPDPAPRRGRATAEGPLAAKSAVRKSYPLTRVGVTTSLPEELVESLAVRTTEYVKRDLAQRLAEELMSQMEVRAERDITSFCMRYAAVLTIVDPKFQGQTVETLEWDGMGGVE